MESGSLLLKPEHINDNPQWSDEEHVEVTYCSNKSNKLLNYL